MARRSRAELWRRGVEKHGRLKWYLGTATFPAWAPLYIAAKWLATGLQKIGDLGYWLERRL